MDRHEIPWLPSRASLSLKTMFSSEISQQVFYGSSWTLAQTFMFDNPPQLFNKHHHQVGTIDGQERGTGVGTDGTTRETEDRRSPGKQATTTTKIARLEINWAKVLHQYLVAEVAGLSVFRSLVKEMRCSWKTGAQICFLSPNRDNFWKVGHKNPETQATKTDWDNTKKNRNQLQPRNSENTGRKPKARGQRTWGVTQRGTHKGGEPNERQVKLMGQSKKRVEAEDENKRMNRQNKTWND